MLIDSAPRTNIHGNSEELNFIDLHHIISLRFELFFLPFLLCDLTEYHAIKGYWESRSIAPLIL
jgi:hypothetical protein